MPSAQNTAMVPPAEAKKGYHPGRGTFIGRPQRGCHLASLSSGNTTATRALPCTPLGQGNQVGSHDPWETWAAPDFLLGEDVELGATEPEFDTDDFFGL